MLAKSIRISGLVVLGATMAVISVSAPSSAQTAVSAAQPATTPSSTAPAVTAPANTAAAPGEPPRSEMIHRALYAIYDKQDNHDLAAAELDELIRVKPNESVFPFAYGTLLMKDSKWTEAIARFQAALKIDPVFSNAYCGIGDCQMKLKEYTAAVESYSNAAKNAKAGQNFTAKVAIAKQWEERKKQEDDYNAALKKLGGGGAKAPAKKKK